MKRPILITTRLIRPGLSNLPGVSIGRMKADVITDLLIRATWVKDNHGDMLPYGII